MSEENEPVIVYAGNPIDAGFVKTLLEANGIAAFLKDEIMGTLAPFYVTPAGVGAVKVVVAKRDLHTAEPIVREFLDEQSERYK